MKFVIRDLELRQILFGKNLFPQLNIYTYHLYMQVQLNFYTLYFYNF